MFVILLELDHNDHHHYLESYEDIEMTTEFIRTLYNYNAWANQRILDTAAQLAPEQLKASGTASFDSIHDTLVHTMGAQWIWLSRWQGISPREMLNPADLADLAAIRERWARIEQDTQTFVSRLDEATLAQITRYATTRGQPKAYPLWQLMLHQVNHATQHRSEVAAMLTQFGHSPGWLDLIMYLEKQKAAADH